MFLRDICLESIITLNLQFNPKPWYLNTTPSIVYECACFLFFQPPQGPSPLFMSCGDFELSFLKSLWGPCAIRRAAFEGRSNLGMVVFWADGSLFIRSPYLLMAVVNLGLLIPRIHQFLQRRARPLKGCQNLQRKWKSVMGPAVAENKINTHPWNLKPSISILNSERPY